MDFVRSHFGKMHLWPVEHFIHQKRVPVVLHKIHTLMVFPLIGLIKILVGQNQHLLIWSKYFWIASSMTFQYWILHFDPWDLWSFFFWFYRRTGHKKCVRPRFEWAITVAIAKCEEHCLCLHFPSYFFSGIPFLKSFSPVLFVCR